MLNFLRERGKDQFSLLLVIYSCLLMGVWGYIHKPYRFNDNLCFVSSMYMHLILIDVTYFISLVLIKMIEELEFQ